MFVYICIGFSSSTINLLTIQYSYSYIETITTQSLYIYCCICNRRTNVFNFPAIVYNFLNLFQIILFLILKSIPNFLFKHRFYFKYIFIILDS